jgi:adenylate cyclase
MDPEAMPPPRPAGTVDPAAVQAISDWLVAQGLATAGFEAMFAGFCERLADADIRLWRGFVSMRTLHPSVATIGYVWQSDTGVRSQSLLHEDLESDEVMRSPFRYMLDRDLQRLRVPLDRPGNGPDFPVLDEFREAGATDYYAATVGFRFLDDAEERTGVIASWATDRPGGFTDADIATLDRLLPRLALSLKATLTWQIAGNVLGTYVGQEAGQRILAGRIRRGQAEVIRAVVLFADLRGFTAMSDLIPRDDLLPTLDAYFECMVPPVAERGGQVLKFIGDGLLAVFDLSGGPRDAVCRQALDATIDALERVEALNAGRRGVGLPILPLQLALHLGDVFYGNVGAHDRQDFTVIGPAVNEASRIEALCSALERNLLISASFVEAATACRHRLVPVGFHVLRGVREPQELFTVVDG